MLVDSITEHEPGRRLVAVEERYGQRGIQGHFGLAAAARGVDAGIAVAGGGDPAARAGDAPPNARVYLRGVNDAKFRRQVVRRLAAAGDRARQAAIVAGAGEGDGVCRRAGRRRGGAALGLSPTRRTRRDGDRRRAGQHRRRHGDGPHARIGRTSPSARIADRRLDDHRGAHRDRRRHGDVYPVRFDPVILPDMKFRGEERGG